MLRTLKNLFTKPEGVSYGDHLRVQAENEALKLRVRDLEQQLLFKEVTHEAVPVHGLDDMRVEPDKPEDRKQYIADVTVFFDNILHRKLYVAVAEVRELLSNIGRQEGTPLSMSRNEYDMFLRGMEAMCWKLLDWANALDAESKESLQEKANQ